MLPGKSRYSIRHLIALILFKTGRRNICIWYESYLAFSWHIKYNSIIFISPRHSICKGKALLLKSSLPINNYDKFCLEFLTTCILSWLHHSIDELIVWFGQLSSTLFSLFSEDVSNLVCIQIDIHSLSEFQHSFQ